jgi:L-amino acid N-acyltransferase YncA
MTITRFAFPRIQAPTTLEQIPAPLHQQYEESGMGEKGLDALIEEAREEVWQAKQARQGEMR